MVSDTIFRASPHFDERPEGERVSLLVIHNISLPPGEYGGDWIDDLFMGCLDPDGLVSTGGAGLLYCFAAK
jgi:AmpD protein